MINPRRWIGAAALAAVTMLALTACTASTPEATAPATEAAVALPTAAPLPTEEPNYCLDCHTDKEQLIANAKVEEEVEKEDEGAG